MSAGVIVIICGAPLLLIGILLFVIRKKTWKYTAQTTGQVIDMCMNGFMFNRGHSGNIGVSVDNGLNHSSTRCPIYSYYVNGKEYCRAGSVAYNKGYVRRMMQKPVMVYYNPNDPQQSVLGKMTGLTFTGMMFSIMGVVTVFVGVILLVVGI